MTRPSPIMLVINVRSRMSGTIRDGRVLSFIRTEACATNRCYCLIQADGART